jgi:hypothetical protein
MLSSLVKRANMFSIFIETTASIDTVVAMTTGYLHHSSNTFIIITSISGVAVVPVVVVLILENIER